MSAKSQEKVVLVTGGLGGIGLATGKEFARNGFNVLLSDLSASASANRVPADKNVHYHRCDARMIDEVVGLFRQCRVRFGRLDVLVTAHGVYAPQRVEATPEDQFDWIMDTNFKGVYFCISEALKLMEEGAIITVGSSIGIAAEKDSPVYCASKAAVHHLARCLAQKVGRKIRVNSIAPGPIDTPLLRGSFNNDPVMIEQYRRMALRGIASPEEVAKMVFFMASDACQFMNGAVVPFDGGESIMYSGEPQRDPA